MNGESPVNFFVNLLQFCEVVDWLIGATAILFLKILLLAPVWIVGFLFYQLLFNLMCSLHLLYQLITWFTLPVFSQYMPFRVCYPT